MAEIKEKQSVDQVTTPPASPTASPSPVYGASSATNSRTSVTRRVSGNETARRIIILIFGIVQAAILLRFAFLLLDARAANDLVNGVLNFSQIFVDPFKGIFTSVRPPNQGSYFEVASIAALIGVTIIEWLAIVVIKIATRQPDNARA